MLKRRILKTTSIVLFTTAFLLGSVAVPFLSKVGADSPLEFTKKVKQEGDTEYKTEITVTDTSRPVKFRIFVYNPTTTTYTNGVLQDEFPLDQTGRVKNRALVKADQTNLIYSEAFVNLPDGKKLKYQAGSTRVYGFNDPTGFPIADINGYSPLFNPQGHRINDIPGGRDEFKAWYVFYADIVDASVPTPKPAPAMEMGKLVNNITQNTGFVESVTANKGDILEYRIWVHDREVGSEAKDVLVKDTLPIEEGQTFVNTANVSGSNFGTLTDTANANTAFVGRLEYIPGTTRTFVHADHSEGVLIADENGQSKLFGSGVSLDTVKGCFEFERFITFRVKVVKPEVLGPPAELPVTGPGATLLLLFASVPAGLVLRILRKKI